MRTIKSLLQIVQIVSILNALMKIPVQPAKDFNIFYFKLSQMKEKIEITNHD